MLGRGADKVGLNGGRGGKGGGHSEEFGLSFIASVFVGLVREFLRFVRDGVDGSRIDLSR